MHIALCPVLEQFVFWRGWGVGFCGLFVVFIPAVCLFFVFVFSFSNCHDAMSGVLYSWKVSKEKCVTPIPPKKTKQKQNKKQKQKTEEKTTTKQKQKNLIEDKATREIAW